MKILLAEDNAVNRKLAISLLQKRGQTVVVAENGQQALEALGREAVDLVLMDIQMPVMDGFDAIRAIRATEKGTGAHLPIIALTAHAMKGDRERCLEAGADEYVSKPIQSSELFAAMDRAIQQHKSMPAGDRTEPSPSTSGVLDLPGALDRVEGDRELFEELARLFAEECQTNLAEIQRALDVQDAPLLQRLAHTLKGASANIGGIGVSAAALRLEELARNGDLGSAPGLIADLESAIEQLLPELDSACRKVPS